MSNEESFMLVSLEENKAKKLAQVISNDTSRKILDLLAKKDSTETEISKELGIPISTVHYNLKALIDSNLVIVEEYHYSAKGKEVNHYKLANKLIIISPKENTGLREVLKKFLPITIITAAATAIIYFIQRILSGQDFASRIQAPMMSKAADDAMLMTESTMAETVTHATATSQFPFALWFLFGALFVIILYLIFEIIAKKRK